MEHAQLTLEELSFEIERFRHLMITAASVYGFESKEVLAYSKELDELIVQFQLQNK
ncbi:aspartyl-phosphate phosphatase Spo0E family protein [Domibacillus robiginosus]|uniref:aspartyl-phosphate phosphatase Spo0E family protein n=1 Tax=Domibacillus robiginosus TaxID=1071054 RepID=UPI0009E47D94|nr:aspartyl-phosphate phosphatase Spo0E family protein [Domibacillus robiginosus]